MTKIEMITDAINKGNAFIESFYNAMETCDQTKERGEYSVRGAINKLVGIRIDLQTRVSRREELRLQVREIDEGVKLLAGQEGAIKILDEARERLVKELDELDD